MGGPRVCKTDRGSLTAPQSERGSASYLQPARIGVLRTPSAGLGLPCDHSGILRRQREGQDATASLQITYLSGRRLFEGKKDFLFEL